MINVRYIYIYQKPLVQISPFLNDKKRVFKVIKLSEFITNKISYAEIDNQFSIDYDVPLTENSILRFLQMTFYPTFSKVTFITTSTIDKPNKQILHEELTKQGYLNFEIFERGDYILLKFGDFIGNLIQPRHSNEFDLLISEEININSPYTKLLTEEIRSNMQTKENAVTINTLAIELSQTKTELENYKTYLQIAIDEQETAKILEFYHAQYEVLPRWYKQFGHIIKIITGKRKLFNK